MTSYIWSSVVAGFEGVAKDRAPGLPLGKMGWAEMTAAYDFIPLARDGQWTSFGLVPKGVDPVYLEVPGIGKVLHAPTIKVNISPGSCHTSPTDRLSAQRARMD